MTSLQDLYAAAWLTGKPVSEDAAKGFKSETPFRFVLLGGPGVGKGTQAGFLSKAYGIIPLSTGEVFRAAKKMDKSELSPAMIESFDYMTKGLLVPDETVVKIVRERMFCLKSPTGFMLDGFPRTIPQANALDEMLQQVNESLTAVLYFELSTEETINRISGRRTCPKCKATYHMTNKPPKIEGKCDSCGADLILREDDRPEAVRTRLEVYQKSTAPLIEFYEKKGLLLRVSSEGQPEDVFVRVEKVLKEKNICK